MILYGTLAHYDYLEILRWTIIRSEGMFLGLSWDAKGLFRRESHIHESDINNYYSSYDHLRQIKVPCALRSGAEISVRPHW